MTKKLDPLPETSDEYWNDAEVYRSTPASIKMCKIGHDYIEENTRYAVCTKCPVGVVLGGWQRVENGSIVDLRTYGKN